MKRIYKTLSYGICALIVLTIILPLFCVNTMQVYANSAQSSWSGVTSSGAIVKGENCPLQVLNEDLTFDIQEFPSAHFNSAQDFLAYSGKVRAEYTFYNPADYTVNATLMFPFGQYPDYFYYDDDTASDTAKYEITVDGVAVEKKVRHTLHSYDFEIASDMSKLCDNYIEDEFFSPDMPVTIYYFDVSAITQSTTSYASVLIPANIDGTKIRITPSNGYEEGKGNVSVGAFVRNGDTLEVSVFGKYVAPSLFQWRIYKDGSEKRLISGNITLNPSKTVNTTFLDYVKDGYDYDAQGEVSQIDYYNAFVDNINRHSRSYTNMIVDYDSLFDIGNMLMRWYEYDISVAPRGQIVNTVTAPIYPSILLNYSSPIFGYNYYLSPADTWASFGTLNITVNTPYFITESSLAGGQKTENGYTYSFSSLPQGEFVFSMCAIENPTKNRNTNYMLIFVLICISALLVFVAMCCLIVGLILYNRKKRQYKQ